MNKPLATLLKPFLLIEFLLFYALEVVLSNLRVAADVLTPKYFMDPKIIEVKIEGLSDRQLFAASNLITMTPGTLSLNVDKERRFLRVHSMYVKDAQAEARKIEKSYLTRIRRVY